MERNPTAGVPFEVNTVRSRQIPVQDMAPVPRAEDTTGPGFADTTRDVWQLSPVIQLIDQARRQEFPPEEGFDPFVDGADLLEGMERYTLDVADSRSRAEMEQRLAVIRSNEDRRERVNEGSMWGQLAGYLLRPESIATMGVSIPAIGVRAGAARWGAFGAGFVASEEALTEYVDPTNPDGIAERIVLGGITAGILGGAIGGIAGRLAGTETRSVRQMADDFAASMVGDIRRVEAEMMRPPPMANEFSPGNQPGIWRAQATSAEWDGRPVFAAGIDRLASTEVSVGGLQVNPMYNAWADLVNQPYRGVHDLANALGGEFGMAFRYNQLGEATELSAFLRSRQWQPKWADVEVKMQESWARHLGHKDPRTVLGVVPNTLARRAQDRIGQALGRRTDDGKLTFDEWKSALFRAHDDEYLQRFDPETRKALAETRREIIQPVMREIGEELERVGALGTPTGMQNRRRILQEQLDHFRELRRGLEPGTTTQQGAGGGTITHQIADTPQAQVQRELLDNRIREIARQMRGLERRMFGTRGLGAVGNAQPGATGATVRQPGREGFDMPGAANDPAPTGPAPVAANDVAPGTQVPGGPSQRIDMTPANDAMPSMLDTDYLPRMWTHEAILADIANGTEASRLFQIMRGEYRKIGQDLTEREFKKIVDGILTGNPILEIGMPGNLGDMLATPAQVRLVRGRVERAGIRGRGDEVEELADILSDPTPAAWRQAQETALGRELGEDVLRALRDEVVDAGDVAAQSGARGGNIGSSRQLSRQIPGDNAVYADFLETDVATLGRMYFQRMPATLEMVRKFGTRDAEDAITDALVRAAGEMDGMSAAQITAKVEDLAKKLRFVRDDTLSDLYAGNPLTMTRQTVDTMKSWAAVTMLGKVIFAQFAELARPLMVNGIRRNAEFAMKVALGDKARMSQAMIDARITGEGIDTTLGLGAQRFYEMGGLNAKGSPGAEFMRRNTQWFNDLVNGPYYIMNLMAPMTDMNKRWQMLVTQHYVIEDMQRLVAGKLTKKQRMHLASLGIDEDFARQVLPWTDPSDTGMNLLQVQNWPDADARARMLAVLAAEARRSIPTAGPSAKSVMSRGFMGMDPDRREWPLVTMPFQFMTFGMAATQRILISGLQGRDASGLAGALAVVGMAYLGNYMRTPEHVWEQTPEADRWYRAVEMSGILGSVSDFNQLLELASFGEMGARPMLGMPHAFGGEYDSWDATGTLVGAAGANPLNMYRAFTDPSLSDWERLSIYRRAVPLNNLFYLDGLARDGQRALHEAL